MSGGRGGTGRGAPREYGPGHGAHPALPAAPTDLNSREQETCQPVHVINVDIQDNHEEATLGAFLICELCQCVSTARPWRVTTLPAAPCPARPACIFSDKPGGVWGLCRPGSQRPVPADPAHGGHGERHGRAAAGVRGEERPRLPAHRVLLLTEDRTDRMSRAGSAGRGSGL